MATPDEKRESVKVQDDDLLKKAVEKLLYIESRLDAAEAGRDAALREVRRLSGALEQLRRQVGDWQRRAVSAESAAESAERELARWRTREAASTEPAPSPDPELLSQIEDLSRSLERYEREREVWLDRMVALGQIQKGEGGEGEDDVLDLSSFIAELRAEMLAMREGRPLDTGPLSSRPRLEQLVEQSPEPEPDAAQLVEQASLTRGERTLALLCAEDLNSPSSTVRRRAAERLAQAAVGVLNPLVLSRLAQESSAEVRRAFVQLLDKTGGPNLAMALGALLRDPEDSVRVVVMDALGRRGMLSVAVARELGEASAGLRRRALLNLSSSDPEAIDLLGDSLADDDASVRRTAALLLAGLPGNEAKAVLEVAAASRDPEIAKLAKSWLLKRGA